MVLTLPKIFQLATRPLQDHRREILRLAREHGARDARIVGSTARGDVPSNSDVNVLLEVEEGHSLGDQGS